KIYSIRQNQKKPNYPVKTFLGNNEKPVKFKHVAVYSIVVCILVSSLEILNIFILYLYLDCVVLIYYNLLLYYSSFFISVSIFVFCFYIIQVCEIVLFLPHLLISCLPDLFSSKIILTAI